MKSFIHTDDFKDLNIGFALDEGFSSKNDTLLAFYEDRRPWRKYLVLYSVNFLPLIRKLSGRDHF